MLDEGSGDRSAIDMHEAIARLGAQFDIDIGSDATCGERDRPEPLHRSGLGLLSDIVVRPALREEDFSRVRQLRLHRLTQIRDMPGALADRAFLKLLYGIHPYGHPPIGTEASLASMTIDDVRSFHARAIRPGDATLVPSAIAITGDRGSAARRVRRLDRRRDGDRAADEAGRRRRAEHRARAGAPQSELRIGHVAVARDTPDYHALVVANTILGGQFVSRINLNLREDKGVTYGARTAFEFRRLPGPFALQVSVQTSATAQAIEESIREIVEIRGSRPCTPTNCRSGSRHHARLRAQFRNRRADSRAAMQLALYDLPRTTSRSSCRAIERVTIDDVSRVMSRHVDPARLTTLIVGDLDAIGADIGRLGLGEPVVVGHDSF
jgi:predicted Zn-dependent peptidase